MIFSLLQKMNNLFVSLMALLNSFYYLYSMIKPQLLLQYKRKNLYRNGVVFLLLLILSSCFTQRKQVGDFNNSLIRMDTSIQAKSLVLDSLIQPYKIKMESEMDVVIGESAVPLSKAQPECTMGNFMADAQLVIAQKYNSKVSISVMNYGGMRIPYLSPGPIKKGDVYSMMPFDNKLAIVQVPGSVLKQFCNHIAKWKGWPISGISFQIKNGEATEIRVNGETVNDQLIYWVAVSDYIANGGDECSFLIPCKKEVKNIFVRDMLIEYIEDLQLRGERLHPRIENRITYAE